MFGILFFNIFIPLVIVLAVLVYMPSKKELEDLKGKELYKHLMKGILVLAVGWTTYNCFEISTEQYKELKDIYDPEIVQMTKNALKDDKKISNGELYLIEMKHLFVLLREKSSSEEYQKKTYKEDLINR